MENRDLDELASNIMFLCKKYKKLYAKVNKKPVVWVKNRKSGELFVYTERNYTDEIIDFINGL